MGPQEAAPLGTVVREDEPIAFYPEPLRNAAQAYLTQLFDNPGMLTINDGMLRLAVMAQQICLVIPQSMIQDVELMQAVGVGEQVDTLEGYDDED